MIELKVNDYCHDCPEFEAEVTKFYGNNTVIRTQVTCQNATRCNRLLNRLKKVVGVEHGTNN